MKNMTAQHCAKANQFSLQGDASPQVVGRHCRRNHNVLLVGDIGRYGSSRKVRTVSDGILIPHGGWVEVNGKKYHCSNGILKKSKSVSRVK